MNQARYGLLIFAILLGLDASSLPARTIHVGTSGDDRAVGDEKTPLRSIQAAVDRAEPGDTVIVQPGIYFEAVQIRKRGAAGKPIVVQAGEFGRSRVIVSGARKDVRLRETK